MDRGLRIRAPHRRHSRPPDPPRAYPRDERRQRPAAPEPRGQGLITQQWMQPRTGLRPVRLVARQLCGEHTRQGARQARTIGHYPAGALALFGPGLTDHPDTVRGSPGTAFRPCASTVAGREDAASKADIAHSTPLTNRPWPRRAFSWCPMVRNHPLPQRNICGRRRCQH